MKKPILKELKKSLDEVDLHCYVDILSKELPVEVLYINLGRDGEGNEFILQMNFAFEASEDLKLENFLLEPPQFLQFFVPLPFSYKEEALPDLLLFLNKINATLEMPGFFVSDFDRTIYYRYVLCHYDEAIDEGKLISLLQILQMYFLMYSKPIQEIAFKEKTLAQFLEESKETLKDLGLPTE